MLFGKKKEEKLINAWDKFYPEGKRIVEVPNFSIYHYFEKNCYKYLDATAINYFSKKMTYAEVLDKIDICASALKSHGIRKGDVVTICMPNTPEAVISFYAVNKIGAIANMLHPLSSEEEIKNSLITTNSVLAIIVNIIEPIFKKVSPKTSLYKVVVVSPKDSMPPLLKLGYFVKEEMKLKNAPANETFINWVDFNNRGKNYNNVVGVSTGADEPALYLHSGGTTGIPKNIVLTNGNVNAIMEQIKIVLPELGVNDSILSILPMFHCFGLVVGICAPLVIGATATLIPRFDAKRFDKLLKTYKPTVLTGVPTLFEALITNPFMKNISLNNIKYVISGGDSLSIEKNKEVNDFFKKHYCNAQVLQGYGMTETTGAVCVGVMGSNKLGSVGIPLPGNKVKIIDFNTMEEKRANEIGEIWLSGPTIMAKYLDNKEETEKTITKLDGERWVRTGDLGYLDDDGVLFFVQRLKRMLIVSGYNVYPSYVEEVILKHPKVKLCGVIGIPHPYKIQVPKAYIVLKDNVEKTSELKKEIREYCTKNLAKYMIPKEFVFKDELPKTMIGKVDYRALEKLEEND